MPVQALIVANPAAAAGAVGRRWVDHVRNVHACFGLAEVVFTNAPGHATTLVRNAIADGITRIIAVGGDGTVNECVNGFVSPDGSVADVQFGIFPLGTGGDLARTIGMRDAKPEALAVRLSERVIDLGRVSSTADDGSEAVRYFLNVASFGASGLIVDKVNATSKRFGGKASFVLGTLKGLTQYRNQRMRLRIDDSFEEEIVVNTVAVGNGRFFGGGMKVTPDAQIDDGKLDVCIIGDVGVGTFVRYSSKIYAGTHGTLAEIRMLRGARIDATPLGEGEVLVDCDGERVGRAPVRFDVLPKRLRMIAPWVG